MELLKPRPQPLRVLFVCTGNICRSPMAAAVLRQLGSQPDSPLPAQVSSAGLRDVHAGRAADERAVAAAAARGYDVGGHVARVLCEDDFARHDVIVGMGPWHLSQILARRPPGSPAAVCSLPDFDDSPHPPEIPDPMSGTREDFERALDLIEAGCLGLERALRPLALRLAPPGEE